MIESVMTTRTKKHASACFFSKMTYHNSSFFGSEASVKVRTRRSLLLLQAALKRFGALLLLYAKLS